jgi:hypothetical protein
MIILGGDEALLNKESSGGTIKIHTAPFASDARQANP